ncbi:MAG: creatininase [Alphaproteobacteria bacterium]
MIDGVRMADLTWPEFAERAKRDPVMFLPCGSFEQHGPHLPFEVDALIPAAIAEGVADRVGGLVLPTLAYGYTSMPKSGGGPYFPGTINLDGATLARLVGDIVREVHRHGLRKLCVIVGHYENQWHVTEGLDTALRAIGDSGFKAMRLEYWDFCTPALIAELFPDGYPGIELEHAAVMETSLMLHLHPDKVRRDLIPDNESADFPPYDLFPAARDWVPRTGALTSAKTASAEKGRLLYEHYVAAIAAAVRKEFPISAETPLKSVGHN